MTDTDILIIGSGMGGATCAAALAPTGARIVILEPGERVQDRFACRDAQALRVADHIVHHDLARGRPV